MIQSHLVDNLEPANDIEHEGGRKIQCGPIIVTLLPSHISISEQQLKDTLHIQEFTRSLTMKSKFRQSEYLRSRFLIHKLLDQSGEIVNDPSGFIKWPSGFCGSLTHKDGLIGLSINSEHVYKGVGIDLEDLSKVHVGLESRIIQSDESDVLQQLVATWPAISREAWLAVAFSFKESIFKCLYPLGRIYFYFHKVQIIAIDPIQSEVEAIILDDVCPFTPKGTKVYGHFSFLHDHTQKWVLTSVLLKN